MTSFEIAQEKKLSYWKSWVEDLQGQVVNLSDRVQTLSEEADRLAEEDQKILGLVNGFLRDYPWPEGWETKRLFEAVHILRERLG